MKYQLAHHSLRGGRATNQDRVAVGERDNAVLMVLADGLGGHDGGELAAETLAQVALRTFHAVRQPIIDRPSAFLALTIRKAHDAIIARGKNHVPPLQPRTTCVLCLIQNGYAYWAHVGDSRLYLIREGEVIRRTQDHTAIEQLRQDGLLSDEELREHPFKNRLLECVGGRHKPTVSLGEEMHLAFGDTVLLCSDGVWEALGQAELTRYLGYAVLEEGVEELLLAIERKMRASCDNISAACLRWEDGASAARPLQGNAAVTVNSEEMWRAATAQVVKAKAQERSPGARAAGPRPRQPVSEDRKKRIARGIREIEDYIRRYEPKPRDH